MKKDMKKYIVILLLAALAFPACNKMLDLRDNGTTDMGNVFSDRNQTRGYINSCYNYVQTPGLRAGSFTDDAQDAQAITSGTKYDYWYNQALDASNFGSYNYDGDPWATYFQGIRKCNVFLDYCSDHLIFGILEHHSDALSDIPYLVRIGCIASVNIDCPFGRMEQAVEMPGKCRFP